MLTARERREQIVEHITSVGHGSVAALAERFAVTPETIRRDLSNLEQRGVVERVHGGAVIADTHGTIERSFWQNEQSHADDKIAIARAAVSLLPEGAVSILIDSGTSTASFAEVLAAAYRGQRWTIVTNSLPAGAALAGAGINSVNLVGGTIKAYTRAVVGEQAAAALASLRADYAFIGTNGISAQHGLSTPDPTEASMKSAMVAAGRKVVLLCDPSKFDRDYLVTFAQLADIDIVVTTADLSAQHQALLRANNIEVVFA